MGVSFGWKNENYQTKHRTVPIWGAVTVSSEVQPGDQCGKRSGPANVDMVESRYPWRALKLKFLNVNEGFQSTQPSEDGICPGREVDGTRTLRCLRAMDIRH